MPTGEERIARIQKSMERRIRVLEAAEFGGGFDGGPQATPILSATEKMRLSDLAVLSVTSASALVVETDGTADVNANSATLAGTLKDLGGAADADCDLQYRIDGSGNSYSFTPDTTISSTPTSFTGDATNLDADTVYEFAARADASDGDFDTGSTLTFRTLDAPLISTDSTSNVTDTSVDVSFTLSALDASSAEVFIEYKESANSTYQKSSTSITLQATGSGTITVDNLSSGTQYDFRALAEESDGDTGRGSVLTETTSGTTIVIDDFDSDSNDPDITTLASNWDGWNQDTGNLSAQSGTVLAGSNSGELSVSSGGDVFVRTNRDNSAQITEVTALVQISSLDGGVNVDAQALRTEGPDLNNRDLVSECLFRQNGDIGAGGSTAGSWSAGTTYKVRLYNHDYSAETYDVEVTRTSDSTVVGSLSGVGFKNSVSGIQSVRLRNDADSGNSGSPSLFFDDVTATS